MNEELSGLYQRICAYSPDDGGNAFTFTLRLARDNGWELEFSRRVVGEYKKFMFLAVAAGHPVTPSEQIDQAWHLHLIYSRSYWDDFCGQVLGTPIHHGPTKGGPDEQDKYHDWYERTKASYTRLLDQSPPPDIWPESHTRFGDDVHCVRVNTRHHWVIPKQRARRYALLALATLVFVATTAYKFHDSGQAESTRLAPVPALPSAPLRHKRSFHDGVLRTAVFARPHPQATNTIASPLLAQVQTTTVIPKNRNRNNAELAGQQTEKQAAIVLGAIIIGAMIVAVAMVIAALFRGKCSSCGRRQTMKKTGAFQQESESSAAKKFEWKCQHCGATMWATQHAASGGCGGWFGCGGGSDCGNSGCGGSGCGGSGCGGGGCGGGG